MTTSEFAGSCLCGTVQYRITGAAFEFFHCHCQRCRKSNGTGHASNVLVKPESAEWISGETELGGYKVPEAEYFRTSFCKNCGSSMPVVAPDRSIAVIPAGSLDTDPTLLPTGRIFWDDRASWSCGSDDIPSWPTYPSKGG